MEKIVNSFLKVLGYKIQKTRRSSSEHGSHLNFTMYNGLLNFKKIGVGATTIIDVGAAAGTWSLLAKKIWPDATFILFEPLAERKEVLEELVRANPNFHYVNAAAGKEQGVLNFSIASDLDGSGVARSNEPSQNIRSVDLTRIDTEAAKLSAGGPYVVKLDTHGFEVPILEGCQGIMNKVELFIIECYGFQIADNSLLFWEMCQFMDKLGFRLFNIVDVMNRKKDGAFWQCDAFFIKKDNPLFRDNKYL